MQYTKKHDSILANRQNDACVSPFSELLNLVWGTFLELLDDVRDYIRVCI